MDFSRCCTPCACNAAATTFIRRQNERKRRLAKQLRKAEELRQFQFKSEAQLLASTEEAAPKDGITAAYMTKEQRERMRDDMEVSVRLHESRCCALD